MAALSVNCNGDPQLYGNKASYCISAPYILAVEINKNVNFSHDIVWVHWISLDHFPNKTFDQVQSYINCWLATIFPSLCVFVIEIHWVCCKFLEPQLQSGTDQGTKPKGSDEICKEMSLSLSCLHFLNALLKHI